MKKSFIYQIRHIQLDQKTVLPTAASAESGWYLVFWWKQIAVGHLYIKPGEVLTETELWHKVYTVIYPTIHAYNNASVALPEYRENDVPGTLCNQLESVLQEYDVETLPEQVPVTVIICTRNRAQYLRVALQALQALPCRPAEIIIVDNAPTDDSTEKVVREFGGVIYCLEPQAGLDFARNTGIRKASMPIIAYTDDDVQVHPHWIYQVWKAFERSEVAAITGLVIAAELQSEAQLIFEWYWSFNRGFVDKIYDKDFFSRTLASGPPVWEIGAGANMAFRRSVFDEIGYFDERLGAGASGCSDDSEMWFRILAQGYTIQYTPRAIAFHTHRQDITALKKQLFSYMRGHTAAALIQQQKYRKAGYYSYLLRRLPFYYLTLFRAGFPSYTNRHQTLSIEVRGVLSGFLFYLNNRKRPPTQLQ